MICYTKNVRFIGCREVVREDKSTVTYGNLYVEGELLPFSSELSVMDSMEPHNATVNLKWGGGKNGQYYRAEVIGIDE